MTKDFFALSVLDPLIVGDESARLYQKLVRQDRLAMSVIGAFNFLGNNWDVKGPMLFTMRVDYLNDKNADAGARRDRSVLAEVRDEGHHRSGARAGEDRAARPASSRTWRAASCRASAAPTCWRPLPCSTTTRRASTPSSTELEKVTVEDVKAAAGRWFVPTNRTSIDSRPAAKPTAQGGAR